MDNLMGGRKDFTAEHGLSLYVETGHTRILFDFGAGAHTFENGQKIKIRPDRIDFAVCSHGHYDHGGGYREFVKNGLQCPLVTGKGFFTEKYAVSGIKSAYLGPGFDQEFLTENHITHMECHGLTPLAPGCWVMGDIRRTYEFESVPGRFVLREQDAWVQDKFCDEICLIIEEQGELVVIVGCSHPGILNILTTVKEHFSQPIKAVIGGTHLMEADEARIRQTVEIMKDMGIRLLGFNHCSGELFRNMMEQEETLSTVYLGAGDCLFLT
ncbi:7,8-dihydropterin-6-yl-methyl-4-(beta-D-ribofuranosyl)aminobenzene 5'-phosphate synthase [Enterocloster citroniae]|uniref:7, 8-dihydropterin-6-yl-methyl-4-(Beta-D-ribofuranosyl)aminobenzene 5'-phosphate synthase n=3 Tax=Enterocloster citroniae TaxID=358743 RepID=A0ABV2FVN5_9FIRM|nr:MBL fold metallo-hydrolase [Enterocloster citroniae]